MAKFDPHANAELYSWDRLLLRATVRPLFSPARARG